MGKTCVHAAHMGFMTTDLDADLNPALAKALDDIRSDTGLLMALSLYSFSHEADYRRIGGGLAREYVRSSYSPTSDAGRLADADRVIREEEPALYGMTFHNMIANLRGENVDIKAEYPSSAARELVKEIVAANPKLAAAVAELKPTIPF